MGVVYLWEILSPVGACGVSLSELSGKTLAVDLSSWILEFRKCEGTNKLHNLYLRNLFYRTLDFMKEGVQLVFVLDGLAPEIKHDKLTKQREKTQFTMKSSTGTCDRPYLVHYSTECVKLIECLGIPWVKSPGEAEEMCAYLNQCGIVDGCISKDSDFFCYGGKTIYRNLRKESKLYIVDQFEMDKIESSLGYCRSDLVAMALLLGCDYNEAGVKTVGKEKAVALLKTWKEKEVDPLQRILGWQGNKELDVVEQTTKSRSHKDSHCKKCNHTGNIKNHLKTGCMVCKTQTDCTESCDIICDCDWHSEDQLIQRHKLELTIRQKSRETTDFIQRSKKIKEEFMKPNFGIDLNKDGIIRGPMNLKALMSLPYNTLYMSQEKVLDIITPVVIVDQLFQDSEEFMYFTPVRIERTCKNCGIEGYLVSWEKTDRNTWTIENRIEVKIEKELFTKKFPQLVKQFQERVSSKVPKGKRKQSSQPDSGCITPAKKTLPTKRPENKDEVLPKKKLLKQFQSLKGQPSIKQFSLAPPLLSNPSVNQSTVSQAKVNPSTGSEPSVSQSSVSQSKVNPFKVSQPSVSRTAGSQPSIKMFMNNTKS